MPWLRLLYFMCLLGFGEQSVVLAAQPLQDVQAVKAESGRVYKFGVFPYLTPLRLEAIYAPVGANLSQALGRPVHFRTSSQFEIFFSKLEAQHYDIALIQPFWYAPAVDRFGYLPLARMEEPFVSLIMTLDESPLRSVDDLRGKTIATPPVFVPVVHMAKQALKEKGLTPGRDIELKAFKSVDSCFQQVLIGSASACVSPPFAPPVIEEKLGIKLRTLMTTAGIPNLTFIVHSRVPPKDRLSLQNAILSWGEDEIGARLLKRIKTRRFVPAHDVEYDAVRALIKGIQKP